MKHKTFTRITSFFLAVCIIVFTSFSYVMPVHATAPADTDIIQAFKRGTSTGDWDSFWDYIWTTGNVMQYLSSQVGAITNKDFNTFMHNNDSFFKGAGNNWFTLDEDNNTLTANQACTVELKSAITEYQKEKYGYKILRTVNYRDIPATAFGNSYSYKTMCNLVKKYKLINISMTPYGIGLKNMEHYLDGSSGFYVHNYYSSSHNYEMFLMDYNNWTLPGADSYYFYGLDKELFSWEDVESYFKDNPKSPDGTYKNSSSVDTYSRSYVRDLGYPFDKSYGVNWLVSDTGSDVLVFNSETALKNYSVDKRSVFTTKKFYEDTGSVTVDLSKLEDEVSDINTALNKLLEQLNDKMTESDIEDLLQKILDELKNNSSSGDSSNTGGNTGGSTGGDSSGGGSVDLSGLSGYFESILDYLDKILQLQYIQTITQSEKDKFKEDTEKLLDENKSTFMEIANEMGKKFPFCIPADLAHLFSKLSGSSDAQTQALLNNSDPDYLMAVASGGGSSGGGSSGDIALASLGDSEVSVMALDSDSEVSVLRSSMDAPYFELPIIIESFGIDEKIEVDLEPFQPVSTFSRSMFSVLFAVALIKFTIHLIPLLSSSTD